MDHPIEHRYNRLTWEEMNEAISRQPVVVLPTGSTEQHGPHMPLDVDSFLCETVCLEAARRAPETMLVLPPVSYGLNRHHIDFPGTIHIEPDIYIGFCLNIAKSVAYHGFRKILIVNGHGSNTPMNDLAARKTTLETESLCASVNYFALALEAFESVRETDTIAHADELETSLYLHLAPERVRMHKAVRDGDVAGEFLSSDSVAKYPVRFADYWGRWTRTGVHGDPRKATAEKGKLIFETAVEKLIALAGEWRAWPIEKRQDQHAHPIQKHIRW